MPADSPITPQRWVNNLIDAASKIADQKNQEERWLAPDAQAWEHPDELLNTLDDYVLNGFIEAFQLTFSIEQAEAILAFRDEHENFCGATPQSLDVAAVLADRRWEKLGQKAFSFARAFNGRWPPAGGQAHAEELLRTWMLECVEQNKRQLT